MEQQRPRRRPVGTRNPVPTSPSLAMQVCLPARQSGSLKGRTGRRAVVQFLYHESPPQVALDLDNLLSAMQALVRPILLDAPSPNVIATGQNLTRTHATFYISYGQRAQVADPLRHRQVHWAFNLPIFPKPMMASPSCCSGEAGAASLGSLMLPIGQLGVCLTGAQNDQLGTPSVPILRLHHRGFLSSVTEHWVAGSPDECNEGQSVRRPWTPCPRGDDFRPAGKLFLAPMCSFMWDGFDTGWDQELQSWVPTVAQLLIPPRISRSLPWVCD